MIGSGIERLHPGASLRGDATVQDDSDGRGPYIKHWDAGRLGPMPSLEEIEAAGMLAEQETIAEREAKVSDRASLRQQVQDETEDQWLARTDAQRWKIVLRILKAIEKRI